MGEKVFIRVTLFKYMIRFGRKGKLALKYIGPYEIMEKVGKMAYTLTLSMSMDRIHNVFYVSSLCKDISDLHIC